MPQLARTTDHVPSHGTWIHERKFDGIRITAHLHRGQVRLSTRTGNDRAADFPQVRDAVARVGTDAVVDGELVATSEGRESLPLLLRRPAARAAGAVEVRLHLFDVLCLAGHDLRELPLATRKEVLSTLHLEPPLHLVAHRAGAVDLPTVCARGWEGLMLKRTDAPYRSGRTSTWLKLVCHRRGRFVVGGWLPAHGDAGAVGALVVGYRRGRELVYAGRVGSGLPHTTSRVLAAHLRDIERPRTPFVGVPAGREARWVVPHLVVEVDFAGWTDAGRLRHARFTTTRTDLGVDDATGETPPATAPPSDRPEDT